MGSDKNEPGDMTEYRVPDVMEQCSTLFANGASANSEREIIEARL